MSRIYLKHYTGFQRHILAEFMTAKELNSLDKKYSEAKLSREIRRANREKVRNS